MKKAAIAVIQRDDRFLAISRRHDPFDMGLPGGKIEDEETIEGGLRREVMEEVGIQINEVEPLMIRNGFEHEVHVYLIKSWIGEPESQEGTRIGWLTEDELSSQKTFGEFNKRMLQIIKQK